MRAASSCAMTRNSPSAAAAFTTAGDGRPGVHQNAETGCRAVGRSGNCESSSGDGRVLAQLVNYTCYTWDLNPLPQSWRKSRFFARKPLFLVPRMALLFTPSRPLLVQTNSTPLRLDQPPAAFLRQPSAFRRCGRLGCYAFGRRHQCLANHQAQSIETFLAIAALLPEPIRPYKYLSLNG